MGVQTGSAKPYTSGLGVERGLRNIICFFVILAHNLKLLFQLFDFTFYFFTGHYESAISLCEFTPIFTVDYG